LFNEFDVLLLSNVASGDVITIGGVEHTHQYLGSHDMRGEGALGDLAIDCGSREAGSVEGGAQADDTVWPGDWVTGSCWLFLGSPVSPRRLGIAPAMGRHLVEGRARFREVTQLVGFARTAAVRPDARLRVARI
jgi:hypothetical protein